MLLNAIVLSGDVRESEYYDQMTGVPKPGYSVNLTVIDAATDEKYTVQLTDGFNALEELKQLKKQGAPLDALRDAATRLQAELPAKFTQLPLEVMRFKGKSAQFITLICRFAQSAAQAVAA